VAVIFEVINTSLRKLTAQWYLTSGGGTHKRTYIQLKIDQKARADWNIRAFQKEVSFYYDKKSKEVHKMNNTALRAGA
jgi:hypothetical protein